MRVAASLKVVAIFVLTALSAAGCAATKAASERLLNVPSQVGNRLMATGEAVVDDVDQTGATAIDGAGNVVIGATDLVTGQVTEAGDQGTAKVRDIANATDIQVQERIRLEADAAKEEMDEKSESAKTKTQGTED